MLLFPVVLLLAASFQPRIFFDKESLWYLSSANVFYLHLIIFSVPTLLFVCQFGGLKLSDIGLKTRQAFSLLWIPVIVWIAEQLVLALLVPFGFAEFRLNEIWLSQPETIKSISSFFANLLATGINEETFFRGFVFLSFTADSAANPPTKVCKSNLLLLPRSSRLLFLR